MKTLHTQPYPVRTKTHTHTHTHTHIHIREQQRPTRDRRYYCRRGIVECAKLRGRKQRPTYSQRPQGRPKKTSIETRRPKEKDMNGYRN